MSVPNVVVPPASEPVSMAEAKNYLKVEADQVADDEMIESLIVSARRQAEELTDRAFVTQTLEMELDLEDLDLRGIELPRPPLQSVVSVKYYDEDDQEHTWEPSSYRVDTRSEPGRILLASGARWPSGLRSQQSVLVRYVAGYGGAANVPADIKTAIEMIVAHWYDNREAQELPPGALRTLHPYKVYGL